MRPDENRPGDNEGHADKPVLVDVVLGGAERAEMIEDQSHQICPAMMRTAVEPNPSFGVTMTTSRM